MGNGDEFDGMSKTDKKRFITAEALKLMMADPQLLTQATASNW